MLGFNVSQLRVNIFIAVNVICIWEKLTFCPPFVLIKHLNVLCFIYLFLVLFRCLIIQADFYHFPLFFGFIMFELLCFSIKT